MKTIKFIGDPLNDGHGAEEINVFGVRCPKGKAVKGDGPDITASAAGSSHFVVEDVKKGRPRKVKADDENGE